MRAQHVHLGAIAGGHVFPSVRRMSSTAGGSGRPRPYLEILGCGENVSAPVSKLGRAAALRNAPATTTLLILNGVSYDHRRAGYRSVSKLRASALDVPIGRSGAQESVA